MTQETEFGESKFLAELKSVVDERKIAYELAGKALELENLGPDGFVKVRPMTNYESIHYSLRYIYDQPDTDIRNRAQRRRG